MPESVPAAYLISIHYEAIVQQVGQAQEGPTALALFPDDLACRFVGKELEGRKEGGGGSGPIQSAASGRRGCSWISFFLPLFPHTTVHLPELNHLLALFTFD